jgi:hypothetical protein
VEMGKVVLRITSPIQRAISIACDTGSNVHMNGHVVQKEFGVDAEASITELASDQTLCTRERLHGSYADGSEIWVPGGIMEGRHEGTGTPQTCMIFGPAVESLPITVPNGLQVCNVSIHISGDVQ